METFRVIVFRRQIVPWSVVLKRKETKMHSDVGSLAIYSVSTIIQLMMVMFYLFIPRVKIRRFALVLGSVFVIFVFPAAMALGTHWEDTYNTLMWIGILIAVVTWIVEFRYRARWWKLQSA